MAERELARDRAETADLLLRNQQEPPADLVARVQAALQASAGRRARAAELERDRNLRIGATARALSLASLGPAWLATELVVVSAEGAAIWWPYVVFEALALAFLCVVGVVMRRALLANFVGRTLALIAVGCSATSLASWVYAAWANLDLSLAHAAAHLILVVGSFSGLGIERRLWLPLVLQVATLCSVLAFPEHAPLISGVLGGAALSSIAWGARVIDAATPERASG